MFHPILLTGAVLVGLPILLHLIMRQEPKRLHFPAFRFLKQRRRTNQRKLRLRHLLLMLLRMCLIILMCVALFQPTLVSEGFSLRGEQPVAAVLVIDTSPSMGYVLAADRTGLSEARMRGLKLLEESPQGPWTALDDARARAMEILDELPPGSKVAVIDTAERGEANWSLSAADARNVVRGFKKPKAGGLPVTRALEQAYNLFVRVDQEMEPGQEPLPRVLYIFSDRTTASWDASRLPDLQQLRDRVPPPSIFAAYIDVGVEKPLNMAITNVELRPQIVPAHLPVVLNVTVTGVGPAAKNAVVCRIADKPEAQTKPVEIRPDGTGTVQFRWDGLPPGLHQAEVSLVTADAQPLDNVRYVTFRVQEPRKVLIVADEPPIGFGAVAGNLGSRGKVARSAWVWWAALMSSQSYVSDEYSADDVVGWKLPDLAKYEAVTLAGVAAPDDELWRLLRDYVDGGGQLVILPGEKMSGYKSEAAHKLLPGDFTELIEVNPEGEGVGWAWDALSYQHPFLAPFREWRKDPNIDFVKFPPVVWRYWQLNDVPKQSVIVSYADSPDADKRHPAIVGQQVGNGRVVVFTTAWDFDQRPGKDWNNYLGSPRSFSVVVPILMTRYLTGDTEDVNFNFLNGQNVLVKWPPGDQKKAFYLEGPDVIGTDAILKREEGQAYLRLGPERMQTAGNFRVRSEDLKWAEGFSLNASPDESNLERIGIDQIEPLLGKDSVAPATKDLRIRDMLKGKFTQPVELFPFLMVLLLLVLALENLLANKFYRQPPKQAEE
jgi:Aerotolerance regulator N-terminal